MEGTKEIKITQTKAAQHFLVVLACIVLCIAMFLSVKISYEMKHRPFPRPREVNVSLIQPWMTIHYISRTYQVPEDILLKELSVSTSNTRTMTVSKIASLQNKKISEVVEQVRDIVSQYQQSYKSPPPPPDR